MSGGLTGGVTDPVKAALRAHHWQALRDAGAARFPGTVGRIPNFVGAEAAAARLAATAEWRGARTIKANPDLPQRPVRHRALKDGKTVFMAVPRLRDAAPFLMLDPEALGPANLWRASSIKGAFELGEPIRLDAMPRIDLIVTGCVGVGPAGERLGKGGGYSDLEWAVLAETGRVGPDTPVATTAHPSQRMGPAAMQPAPHDLSVDLIATPEGLTRVPRSERASRPAGVLWPRLPAEALAEMPALAARAPRPSAP